MTRKPGGLPPMNKLVESRVDRLLSEARQMHAQDGKLAVRYVELALALASRHRFRLGNARRHLYCAKCHVPWIAGRTVMVRLMARERMSRYTCACGHSRKFSYSK